MSYADKWTDEQVEELEERIARLYSEAQKDFKKQADAYFAQFAKKDDEMREKVESGEVSKEEYKQWRLTQMGRGERLNHMARQMAERATKANEVAVAYVNDTTPSIYSLNRNHEAYEIEKLGHEMVGADFSLYNEQAVRRIMVEDPDLMPYYPADRALKRGIDLAYGQQYIKRHITGGIIQGKSVYDIADDLQRDVANMNRASAVRTARTAMTAAQNGGRQATMDSARAMGIKLRKRWVAAKDGRTRDVHGTADRQTVPTDEPFIVGGERLMFPGDRTSASAWNIYNCRCGMRTVEKEGIEAEPRKVRIQNPAWTDAYEAEEKAKAKYEKALEREKAETDPVKKKALRKARLEKQHEYEGLQQKRREIPKNMVVNDMTYTEWAKLRTLSTNASQKNLTSYYVGGKIPTRVDDYRMKKIDSTIAEDIGTPDSPTCNPNFKKRGGYIKNCANCTVTYEMRRRGFDVVANPSDPTLKQEWKKMFVNPKPIYTISTYDKKALVEDLEQKLIREGNGARGAISVMWDSERPGHVFSWEVIGDKVHFVDAQTGMTDASIYFELALPHTISCYRWDGCEPANSIIKCCSNRGGS